MTLLVHIGVLSFGFTVLFTVYQALHHDQGVGQSKRSSIVEAWTNILIGFSINYVANLVLLPLVGVRPTLIENFWLGWIYTAVSIVRQYAVRRWFNARIHALTRRLS